MTSHDRQQRHETAQNTDDDQSTSYQLDENGDPLGWADTQRPSPEWSESEKLFGPSPIEGALAAVLDEVRELTEGEIDQLHASAAQLALRVPQRVQIDVDPLRAVLRSQCKPSVCHDSCVSQRAAHAPVEQKSSRRTSAFTRSEPSSCAFVYSPSRFTHSTMGSCTASS